MVAQSLVYDQYTVRCEAGKNYTLFLQGQGVFRLQHIINLLRRKAIEIFIIVKYFSLF